MKIENVCIVGGGSSGWMTAAVLSKWLPKVKVTLVESPDIGTIGVGESTIGHFNKFLKMLDLKDEDWMPHCNATYKTSIKFTDFRESGSVFHYPFGRYDMTDAPLGMMTWFELAARDPENFPPESFAKFFHSSVDMIDANKITLEANKIRGFFPETDLAYHLDATAFGQFLKNRFCENVNHIQDTIKIISQEDNGNISQLGLESGLILQDFDLFIDCSGFKSMLLEGIMKEPFESFKDVLPNDRAVAAQIPYENKDTEMKSVTNCTALSSGWVWNIPLYHRIGTGYVYSSQYQSKESAEKEFRAHLGERGDYAVVKHIEIKNGIHKRAWVGNVVGVGLANGFIEPLESTGLMLTHETILYLVRTLMQRNCVVSQYNIDGFNFAVRDAMEGFRHFISLHYALSPRDDTPYWKAVSEREFDKTVAHYGSAKVMKANTSVDLAYRFNESMLLDENMGGLPYIVAGMGMNPINELEIVFRDAGTMIEGAAKTYFDHKAKNLEIIDTLDTHYQYLKKNIHKD